MKRRDFIAGLTSAAALPFWEARAQTPVPTIGVLASASPSGYALMFEALRKGLADGGFIEGQTVRLTFVFAEDQYNRLPALAAGLVRNRVNLILAASTPAALAAKPATSTIPIVFATGGDPERIGLVESLSRPGGNLTGAAHVSVETAPKRFELMHELLPPAKALGLLVNPTNPLVGPVVDSVKAAAAALGVELHVLRAASDAEIDAAFANLTAMKLSGLVIGTDPFFTAHSKKLAVASLGISIPAIYQYREFAAAGGVMSYGGSITDSYFKAGVYAARILKGEKPSDLPVQLSTKVELFLNLKSAKQLGIDVPLSLLGRADEIME